MAQPIRKDRAGSTAKVSRRPDLKVERGTKARSAQRQQTSPGIARAVFVTAIVCVMMVAVVAGFRVYIASEASVAAIESAEIQKELDLAYKTSTELELRQSLLSQGDRIKEYAKTELGMAQAKDVMHISIAEPGKAVTTDLPDTVFENDSIVASKNSTSLVAFVQSLFAPSQAGASVVSAP